MSKGPWKRPVMPVRAMMTAEELPFICTSAEVGQFLRCSPEQVQRKALRGEIAGYKEGQTWRFRREDVLGYLERKLSGKEASA